MRLIDADALVSAIDAINSTDYGSIFDYNAHREVDNALRDVLRIVCDAPTIDAVPVVMCKDCKHRKDPFVCPMCGECVAPEGEDWGVYDWGEDDGFCHKGERRADNE